MHGLMVGCQVMLSEVICFVGSAQSPKDIILALANMIMDPVEMHVNGLGALLLDVVVGNTSGSGVVGLNRGCGLGMAKLEEGNAQWTSMFGIEKQCTQFDFSGAGQDQLHDLTEDINGAIVGGQVGISGHCGWWCGAEKVVSGGV